MLKVKSTIKINKSFINQLDENVQQALLQTAEQIHHDVVPYIPFDCPTDKEKARGAVGGTLSEESTFVDKSKISQGKVSIVSSTPYARRLYYHPEYNFDKGEHPQARGHWFEAIKSEEIKDTFIKYLKQNIGDSGNGNT